MLTHSLLSLEQQEKVSEEVRTAVRESWEDVKSTQMNLPSCFAKRINDD